MVSLKVAPVPGKAVQVVYGETDRCQLYVGPDDAGVPVEAAVVLVILLCCRTNAGSGYGTGL